MPPAFTLVFTFIVFTSFGGSTRSEGQGCRLSLNRRRSSWRHQLRKHFV